MRSALAGRIQGSFSRLPPRSPIARLALALLVAPSPRCLAAHSVNFGVKWQRHRLPHSPSQTSQQRLPKVQTYG